MPLLVPLVPPLWSPRVVTLADTAASKNLSRLRTRHNVESSAHSEPFLLLLLLLFFENEEEVASSV
jgi:hypothetical protein